MNGDQPADRLANRTWTQVADRPRPLVLVPVGSTEQHGPHLPLDTDLRIATEVATRVVRGSEMVAPPIAYGASGEHAAFPGTLSIGHEALHAVLVELGRSAAGWVHRLVFVNGHGGNLPTVPGAVRQLRAEGRDVAWFGCAVPGGDAHAGHTETSIMMALDPASVRGNALVVGNTDPLADLMPALVEGGVAAVSPNGVLGDPRAASAANGEILLAEMVRRLRDGLDRWQRDAHGRLS